MQVFKVRMLKIQFTYFKIYISSLIKNILQLFPIANFPTKASDTNEKTWIHNTQDLNFVSPLIQSLLFL